MKKRSLLPILIITALLTVTSIAPPVKAERFSYNDADTVMDASRYVGYNKTVGDINGDGKDDLIMSEEGYMYIFLNGNIPNGEYDISTGTQHNMKFTGFPNGTYWYRYTFEVMDVNSDNKDDLVVIDNRDGGLFVFYSTLLDDYSGLNNNFNVSADPSSYSFNINNFTGGLYSDQEHVFYSDDINGDNKKDIIVNTYNTTYYFDSSIFINSTPGTQYDLTNPNNYTAIINTSDDVNYGIGITLGDVTGDNKADLMVTSDNNSEFYFLSGSELSKYTGTGNNIDMYSNSVYSIKLVEQGDRTFDDASMVTLDINRDGTKDLIIGDMYNVYVLLSDKMKSWENARGLQDNLFNENLYTFMIDQINYGSYTFGYWNSIFFEDVNQNGKPDLIIMDPKSDFYATSCGSAWIFFDSLIETYTQASAPNNSFDVTDSSSYNLRIKGGAGGELGFSNWRLAAFDTGDLDKDGYKDIVISSKTTSYSYTILSKELAALGSSTGNEWILGDETSPHVYNFYTNMSAYWSQPIIAEITGDVFEDLIFSDGSDPVYIFNGVVKKPDLAISTTYKSGNKTPESILRLSHTITNLRGYVANNSLFESILPANLAYKSAQITSTDLQQYLYTVSSNRDGTTNIISKLREDTGAVISETEITLSGETIVAGHGLMKNPITSEYYAILRVDEGANPDTFQLVSIDLKSAVATAIGVVKEINSSNLIKVSEVAFRQNGVLYIVSGKGDPNFPATLFTLDLETAKATEIMQFRTGYDGQAIEFGGDGYLYHLSGWNFEDIVYEKVDLDTLQITPIPISGDLDFYTTLSLSYKGEDTFYYAAYNDNGDPNMYSLTTAGMNEHLWPTNNSPKSILGAIFYDIETCTISSQTVSCNLNSFPESFTKTSTINIEVQTQIKSTTSVGSNITVNSSIETSSEELDYTNNSSKFSFVVKAPTVAPTYTSPPPDKEEENDNTNELLEIKLEIESATEEITFSWELPDSEENICSLSIYDDITGEYVYSEEVPCAEEKILSGELLEKLIENIEYKAKLEVINVETGEVLGIAFSSFQYNGQTKIYITPTQQQKTSKINGDPVPGELSIWKVTTIVTLLLTTVGIIFFVLLKKRKRQDNINP